MTLRNFGRFCSILVDIVLFLYDKNSNNSSSMEYKTIWLNSFYSISPYVIHVEKFTFRSHESTGWRKEKTFKQFKRLSVHLRDFHITREIWNPPYHLPLFINAWQSMFSPNFVEATRSALALSSTALTIIIFPFLMEINGVVCNSFHFSPHFFSSYI
jgi:hypothetical protein